MLLTETTIANRGLQRLGASEIAAGALWTEDSRNAREMRRCYDIVRRTELRRNVWRYSIRNTVLRPYESGDTKLVTWAAWSAATSYAINDIVSDDGEYWVSLVAGAANDPGNRDFTKWTNYIGPDWATTFDVDTVYMAGDLVYSGSTTYLSIANNNEGNTPPNATYWFDFTTDPVLSLVSFLYPIGIGPSSATQARNIYRLPHGWLREAPQAPKQGSYRPLGAPSALYYSDWMYEGQYITSVLPGPITYRYTADIEDPAQMDPMFVDGFTCRLAFETCEPITQSLGKQSAVGGAYNKFMSEARMVNAIEQGPVETPLDSYLTSRL